MTLGSPHAAGRPAQSPLPLTAATLLCCCFAPSFPCPCCHCFSFTLLVRAGSTLGLQEWLNTQHPTLDRVDSHLFSHRLSPGEEDTSGPYTGAFGNTEQRGLMWLSSLTAGAAWGGASPGLPDQASHHSSSSTLCAPLTPETLQCVRGARFTYLALTCVLSTSPALEHLLPKAEPTGSPFSMPHACLSVKRPSALSVPQVPLHLDF